MSPVRSCAGCVVALRRTCRRVAGRAGPPVRARIRIGVESCRRWPRGRAARLSSRCVPVQSRPARRRGSSRRRTLGRTAGERSSSTRKRLRPSSAEGSTRQGVACRRTRVTPSGGQRERATIAARRRRSPAGSELARARGQVVDQTSPAVASERGRERACADLAVRRARARGDS